MITMIQVKQLEYNSTISNIVKEFYLYQVTNKMSTPKI